MKLLRKKKLMNPFVFVFVLFSMGLSFSSCAKTSSDDLLGNEPLSSADSLSLMQMREEEKMAKDVYLELYDIYGLNIFSNIASSEQTHMDEVLKLMTAYGMSDPATNERGVFVNQDIQNLYNSLVEKGKKSLTDALEVGAMIEDVDIYDLQNFIASTNNTEIKTLYSFLNCGSRNHMRAFTSQLNGYGIEYVPQYISEDEYEAIINSNREPCGRQY
ncbi:MAG: DUF2202 domain-containing protein [Bacteroidales bacterium]|nr:DUF2202 domain-containing protein [Bacteroidales bacterium]